MALRTLALPVVAGQEVQRHMSSCPGCDARRQQAMYLDDLLRHRVHEDDAGDADDVRLPDRGVAYTGLLSPLGTMWVAAGPDGLLAVESWCDELVFSHLIERVCGVVPIYRPLLLRGIVRQFDQYFSADRVSFDVPLDLSRVPPFQRSVLRAVAAIPYGEVASYRDIAFSVGKPGATRAVGGAVATNPVSIVIPCHRVVRSDGSPGEYALRSIGSCGVYYKLMLLALEAGMSGRSSPGQVDETLTVQ